MGSLSRSTPSRSKITWVTGRSSFTIAALFRGFYRDRKRGSTASGLRMRMTTPGSAAGMVMDLVRSRDGHDGDARERSELSQRLVGAGRAAGAGVSRRHALERVREAGEALRYGTLLSSNLYPIDWYRDLFH